MTVKNCPPGQLSVFVDKERQDYFFDISNTSGVTKDIRWTLYRNGTPNKIVSVSLNVKSGTKVRIGNYGWRLRVEHRPPGRSWWSYGCEHNG